MAKPKKQKEVIVPNMTASDKAVFQILWERMSNITKYQYPVMKNSNGVQPFDRFCQECMNFITRFQIPAYSIGIEDDRNAKALQPKSTERSSIPIQLTIELEDILNESITGTELPEFIRGVQHLFGWFAPKITRERSYDYSCLRLTLVRTETDAEFDKRLEKLSSYASRSEKAQKTRAEAQKLIIAKREKDACAPYIAACKKANREPDEMILTQLKLTVKR